MSDNQLPPPVVASQPSNVGADASASTGILPSVSDSAAIDQQQSGTHSTVDTAGTVAATIDIPAIAEDVDLIEKEWVNKAKNIVEQTRNNPTEQSKKLGEFKASYVKARYGKDLKVTE